MRLFWTLCLTPVQSAGLDGRVPSVPGFAALSRAELAVLVPELLLGGHLIGPDVSELLPELTLAQKWDLTALEAARNVHTHPTLSEALQEGFHGLVGHMINL